MKLGKGIFIWKTSAIANGDPVAIADTLKDAGFEWVQIKGADGYNTFKSGGNPNITPRLVSELKSRNIGVWGWQFNYAARPDLEAHKAIELIVDLDLDGWVFDWEARADTAQDAPRKARELVQAVKAQFPYLPLGFCSWALHANPVSGSGWHPKQVAVEAMKVCDIGMPMAYWVPVSSITPRPPEGVDNALWWLEKSFASWKSITGKPIVPIGRAYNGDGTIAKPDAVRAFGNGVRARGLAGESWWSMEHALPLPDIWRTLSELPKWGIDQGNNDDDGQLADLVDRVRLLEEMMAEFSARQEAINEWIKDYPAIF